MGLWAMGYGLLAGRNGSHCEAAQRPKQSSGLGWEPLDRHAAKGPLAMTDQPIANSQ